MVSLYLNFNDVATGFNKMLKLFYTKQKKTNTHLLAVCNFSLLYGDGGEYREVVSENFELSKLDKSIKNIFI